MPTIESHQAPVDVGAAGKLFRDRHWQVVATSPLAVASIRGAGSDRAAAEHARSGRHSTLQPGVLRNLLYRQPPADILLRKPESSSQHVCSANDCEQDTQSHARVVARRPAPIPARHT